MMMRGGLLTCWTGLLLAMLALVGCGNGDQDDQTNPDAKQQPPRRLRIASLNPEMSQLLVDMGFGEIIVARTRDDHVADEQAKIVDPAGSLDIKRLLDANPDIVFGLYPQGEMPTDLNALPATSNIRLITYEPPRSLSDLIKIIYDENDKALPPSQARSLSVVLNAREEALDHYIRLVRPLGKVRDALAGDQFPRVLLLTDTSPLTAMGPGTLTDNILYIYLNAVSVTHDAPTSRVNITTKRIKELDPDVIVLLRSGATDMPTDPQADGDPEAAPSLDKAALLAKLGDMDVKATRSKRVGVVTVPRVMVSGTSMATMAAQMAKIIYPERAKQIDEALDLAAQEEANGHLPEAEPQVTRDGDGGGDSQGDADTNVAGSGGEVPGDVGSQ